MVIKCAYVGVFFVQFMVLYLSHLTIDVHLSMMTNPTKYISKSDNLIFSYNYQYYKLLLQIIICKAKHCKKSLLEQFSYEHLCGMCLSSW